MSVWEDVRKMEIENRRIEQDKTLLRNQMIQLQSERTDNTCPFYGFDPICKYYDEFGDKCKSVTIEAIDNECWCFKMVEFADAIINDAEYLKNSF